MVKKTHLERGDIVWIDFDPTKGHEQSGKRPSVVISPNKYNSLLGMVVVCPITKISKGYFFEVPISGLPEKSFALVDQLRSVDCVARVVKRAGKVSDYEMTEILAKVSVLLQ